MAYDFYLDKCLLPVPPSKLEIKQKGQNKSLNLINEGEINLLKSPKLKEIRFSFLIPQVSYPFAVYGGSFKTAEYYLNRMKALSESKYPFQFIVSRMTPGGKVLFSSNITVSMEELTVTESAEEGFDLVFDVFLKQYKAYGITSFTVKSDGTLSEESRERKYSAGRKATIGCNVIVNGRLHGNSHGEAPGQTRTNYRGKINYINPGASHPYHITTPDGLWQGWVTADSVKVV